jgi:hypothetical protein
MDTVLTVFLCSNGTWSGKYLRSAFISQLAGLLSQCVVCLLSHRLVLSSFQSAPRRSLVLFSSSGGSLRVMAINPSPSTVFWRLTFARDPSSFNTSDRHPHSPPSMADCRLFCGANYSRLGSILRLHSPSSSALGRARLLSHASSKASLFSTAATQCSAQSTSSWQTTRPANQHLPPKPDSSLCSMHRIPSSGPANLRLRYSLVPLATLWELELRSRGHMLSLLQSSHPKPCLVTRVPRRVGMGHAHPTIILRDLQLLDPVCFELTSTHITSCTTSHQDAPPSCHGGHAKPFPLEHLTKTSLLCLWLCSKFGCTFGSHQEAYQMKASFCLRPWGQPSLVPSHSPLAWLHCNWPQ